MIHDVKVFGERNSGNNYLIHLIRNNTLFDPQPLHHNQTYGWTHGKPKITPKNLEDIYFIILVKNPYAWLLSLHTRPYGENPEMYKRMKFEEFIRISFEGHKNPMELWNKKYQDWKTLFMKASLSHICQYEELLRDSEKMIKNIFWTISKVNESFKEINQYTRADGELQDNLFDKRDYYLNEEYLPKLGEENIRYINKHIDKNLVEYYGYRLHTNI